MTDGSRFWLSDPLIKIFSKEHGWQPVIFTNGLGKVLQWGVLWHKLANPPTKKETIAVHADETGKTCNVALSLRSRQALFLLPAKNLLTPTRS